MDEPILLGLVEPRDDGALAVLAPRVGWWSDLPHAGALVGPGSSVGRLQALNRRYRLVLPEGAAGAVAGGLPHSRIVAVEYGQELFRMTPVGEELAFALEDDRATMGHPAGAGLEQGARAVVAPSDGVFYRRPTPDAPPFVEVGRRVRRGQPVGLVEVMKTFNQILFDGPGFPDEAEVIELRAGDAVEVKAGEVLVVFR